jgi:hypothetical protein
LRVEPFDGTRSHKFLHDGNRNCRSALRYASKGIWMRNRGWLVKSITAAANPRRLTHGR